MVLAAIVRRQVIDRDVAIKLPFPRAGLLDGQHHPADIRQRSPRREQLHTVPLRPPRPTSPTPPGEVLLVGAYAVIVPQPRWCG